MSLKVIRQLRRHGQKPSGVITVLAGQAPRWLEDDAGVVVVRAADDPRFMDWRPLVGLWVAVFSAHQEPARMLALLEALHQVGVKFYGMVDHTGAYPTVLEPTERHELNLQRTWEALCR
jgi:hypothetical protein